MKRFFYLFLSLILFNACYDDTQLWDELRDHEARIQKLEEMCSQMNSNIAALKELVSVIETGDYITDVRMYRENGVEVGYEITFSKARSIIIYHGSDGKDGADGSAGSGGNIVMPAIGIKEAADGVMYWTIGGEWLLDENGKKVKAVGVDGKDGEDGKDGVTPKFKIEDDYWYVSYEDGADGSWQRLGKAVGENGKDGVDGEDGENGSSGSSVFKSVVVSDDGFYVIFTLTSGDVFEVPTLSLIEDLAESIMDLAETCLLMNENIEALATAVAALQNNVYVTAVTVIEENGKEIGYRIEFSNETSATIYHGKDGAPGKDGQDGEDGQDGKDGAGTTPKIGVRKDTDGLYYWTVDGEWLLNDQGQKVAVSGSGTQGAQGAQGEPGIPGKDGVTPQLKIEEGYWYVSYDNGQTWEKLGKATGEDGKDGEDGEDGNDGQVPEGVGSCVFQDVVVNNDAVVLILADGTEVVLPRKQEDQAVLGLSQQNFYLRYGATKTLQLTASGIAEYCVMSKPDGWKATLDGTTLKISSPQKKVVEVGAAELTGEVIIHATTDAGRCLTAKVAVTTGPGLTLDVDVAGNMIIKNSYVIQPSYQWGDVPSENFAEVAFGIAAPEGFLEDPQQYIKNCETSSRPEGDVYGYLNSIMSWIEGYVPKSYVEGEYETDVLELTVAEAYNICMGEELQQGADYVIWVAPTNESGMIIPEDVVYVEYVARQHDVKVSEVHSHDIFLTANCSGASSYVVMCVSEEDYIWYGSFEDYFKMRAEYITAIAADELPASFEIGDLLGMELLSNMKYKILVLPVIEGKQMSEYDFKTEVLPFVIDVTTSKIVPGGSATVTCNLSSVDYTSISVDISLGDDAEVVYYSWYSPDEHAAFNGDKDAIVDDLIKMRNTSDSDVVAKLTGLNPDTKKILAAFAVDAEDRRGELMCREFLTSAVPYDGNIIVEYLGGDRTNSISLSVTGADKVIGWLPYSNNEKNDTYFPLNVCKYGNKESLSGYSFADVKNGEADLSVKLSYGTAEYCYVAAYNLVDGVVSAICETYLKVDLADGTVTKITPESSK